MPSLKRNAAYNASYSALRLIFPLITYPYISRIIGPEGVGRVIFAEAVAGYFCVFALLGLPQYGAREVARAQENPQELKRTFSGLFILSTLLSWSALVVYGSILFVSPRLAPDYLLFTVFGINIFVNSGKIDWLFNGLEKFGYITIRNLIIRVLSVVMILAIINESHHYVRYALVGIGVTMTTSTLNVAYGIRTIGLKFSNLQLRKHLRNIVPSAALAYSTTIFASIDIIMLGLLLSEGQYFVGLYNTAGRIIRIALSLVTSVILVTVPRTALKFSKGDEDGFLRVVTKSASFSLFLGIPAMLWIFFLAPDMIRLFAGVRFLEAVSSMRILAPEVFVLALTTVMSGQLLYSRGREKVVLYVTVGAIVLAFALNLLLIPLTKHDGAAIATMITRLLVLVVYILICWKDLAKIFKNLQIGRILIANSVLFLFSFTLVRLSADTTVLHRFIAITLSSGIIYLATSVILGIYPSLLLFRILRKLRRGRNS